MAAAAIVERPRAPSALPAGPPSRSSSSGTRSLQKSPVKTSLPGKVPPPGKAVVPAKPAPHPPVVTTQPAAVTLPPPVPGQPKKDGSPARKASGPGGVRLTARPSCLEEPLPEFGDAPVVLRCPQCFRLVQTRIELENGRFAKTTACMVCCSVVWCFLTAVDIACFFVTAVIVAVLIIALVVLTDQSRTDSWDHRLESIIRGPFGVVRGIAQPVVGSGGYAYAFLGIPFAQPPIGRLRFKAPLERPKVVNASQAGPACIQPQTPGNPRRVSEDCLHLNIWTPHPNCTERNLPACASRTVLFFLHGDNFQEGGNNDPLLDARQVLLDTTAVKPPAIADSAYLSLLGDVVVVVPNYRLGALGFLLDNGTEAPGNAGLYDQLAALAWVRTNIAYFGGNGSNVVAVGYGAGASSIGYLLFSSAMSGPKPTVPRFDSVIIMSQGPYCRYSPNVTSSTCFPALGVSREELPFVFTRTSSHHCPGLSP
ncbi:hypothetical protein HPB48_020791 [Haemaphysalis longicornis]|uniref:Carboxylesterase type B domain-containing protein n=1 Tax=Haemaphysalis longicornis TaxID=44386 RepID=A0A9J6GRB0_HAELO|nr:hypothetical protein HPB48_020791 [Haemaphysalis longicornis]